MHKLNHIFTILLIMFWFGTGTFYAGRHCNSNKSEKFCGVAGLLSRPSEVFINGATEAKQYILEQKLRTTSSMISPDECKSAKRFENLKRGLTFKYPKNSRPKAGYLLLSRANADLDGVPSVVLYDLDAQSSIYEWKINLKKALQGTEVKTYAENSVYFMHPLLLPDGGLVVNYIKPDQPLIKFNLHGDVEAINTDFKFSHSLEIDNAGQIYVPIEFKKPKSNGWIEEGFAILNSNLKVLKVFSLVDIFTKAGLEPRIFSNNGTDITHLNEVQPVPSDKASRFVLLSLRSTSSVIAYDLIAKKIVWIVDGFFNQQHDVELISQDGSEISIFDNNVQRASHHSSGNLFTIIRNLPPLHADDNLSKPMVIYYPNSRSSVEDRVMVKREDFSFLNEALRPITKGSGRAKYIPENGSVFVEETQCGRAFEYDIFSKNLLWEFVNKTGSKDPLYFTLGWSRRMKSLPNGLTKSFFN